MLTRSTAKNHFLLLKMTTPTHTSQKEEGDQSGIWILAPAYSRVLFLVCAFIFNYHMCNYFARKTENVCRTELCNIQSGIDFYVISEAP
jgi:hypothetical protein